MNSVERVKQICKERKIPISKMEKDLGYSNGYIGQLRKGVFPSDRLQKITDYLGVTIDYLMTGNNHEEVTAPESELSNVYFSLAKEAQQNGIDPRDIKMAIEMLRKIREEEKK